MNPVIKRIEERYLALCNSHLEHPTKVSFRDHLNTLGPSFYATFLPDHLAVVLEYSVLCNQLRTNMNALSQENKERVIQQLRAALMLAEFLEHIHRHYLVVPREVERFRQHQFLYRELLSDLSGQSFSETIAAANPDWTVSQRIRVFTAENNWYRLLFVRAKRLFDMIDVVNQNAGVFGQFVFILDKATDPIVPYLGWCFLLPRLLSNLFFTFKHVIPGSWMDEKEAAVDWQTRFWAQMQRRWFELANDSTGVAVGLINCFFLTGALAPSALVLSITFFAFDVSTAAIRAYIELTRLAALESEYINQLQTETNDDNQNAINDYLQHLTKRIDFENRRFTINVGAITAIFISMLFLIPAFAVHPVIPFIGAVLLVIITLANFILMNELEKTRPQDEVQRPSNLSNLGFFARNQPAKESDQPAYTNEILCN